MTEDTLKVGDTVRVLPPFDAGFPGLWVIEAVNPETGAFQIAGGIDFAADHLQKVA